MCSLAISPFGSSLYIPVELIFWHGYGIRLFQILVLLGRLFLLSTVEAFWASTHNYVRLHYCKRNLETWVFLLSNFYGNKGAAYHCFDFILFSFFPRKSAFRDQHQVSMNGIISPVVCHKREIDKNKSTALEEKRELSNDICT